MTNWFADVGENVWQKMKNMSKTATITSGEISLNRNLYNLSTADNYISERSTANMSEIKVRKGDTDFKEVFALNYSQ